MVLRWADGARRRVRRRPPPVGLRRVRHPPLRRCCEPEGSRSGRRHVALAALARCAAGRPAALYWPPRSGRTTRGCTACGAARARPSRAQSLARPRRRVVPDGAASIDLHVSAPRVPRRGVVGVAPGRPSVPSRRGRCRRRGPIAAVVPQPSGASTHNDQRRRSARRPRARPDPLRPPAPPAAELGVLVAPWSSGVPVVAPVVDGGGDPGERERHAPQRSRRRRPPRPSQPSYRSSMCTTGGPSEGGGEHGGEALPGQDGRRRRARGRPAALRRPPMTRARPRAVAPGRVTRCRARPGYRAERRRAAAPGLRSGRSRMRPAIDSLHEPHGSTPPHGQLPAELDPSALVGRTAQPPRSRRTSPAASSWRTCPRWSWAPRR